MTKQSTVLRELLNAEELLVSIWGGTAHHAQLAETCGFKAFGVSGSPRRSGCPVPSQRIGQINAILSPAPPECNPENTLGASSRPPPAATPRPRRWRRPQHAAAAAAAARMDMPRRMGYAEVLGVSQCEGLDTAGWGKLGGGAPQSGRPHSLRKPPQEAGARAGGGVPSCEQVHTTR
jgi:hypothetical protein